MDYKCKSCDVYFISLKLFVLHCSTQHHPELYECPIEGCNRIYNVKSSFRTHLNSHFTDNEKESVSNSVSHNIADSNETELSTETDNTPSENFENFIGKFQDRMLAYSLKLYSDESLPRKKVL